MKACATESFQWTQRVQKGALFWSPNGTLKKGSFLPPFRWGSEIGSKVEVLMVLRSIDIRFGYGLVDAE